MKRIIVIDGQGGGLGRAIIERILRESFSSIEIIAVGTNALATAAMMKAGADGGASGESAVIWNCQRADLVIGPTGILAAGSMLGELSPAMAQAIGSCDADKILIPLKKCRLEIVGVSENNLPGRLDEMIILLNQYFNGQSK